MDTRRTVEGAPEFFSATSKRPGPAPHCRSAACSHFAGRTSPAVGPSRGPERTPTDSTESLRTITHHFSPLLSPIIPYILH